jgi:4-alpha-glucanotransferase
MRARDWGVAEGYHRSDGRWHDAPLDTVSAVLTSMGADGADAPPLSRSAVLDEPVLLVTEDGGEVRLEGGEDLPPDLPFGYHSLTRLSDGECVPLVVSPRQCLLPTERAWGWAVQVYAARSERSWGIGDLGDLGRLASWSAKELGAGLALVSPLHAALPGLPQEPSPYFPSSRRFRNPLYLRVEDVAGAGAGSGSAGDALADLADLASAGRALNGNRRIDRDAVYRLKMDALERLWDAFGGDPGFDRFRAEQGEPLEGYATFCALTEEYGRPWSSWPAEVRRPDSRAVGAFRHERRDRVDFHVWLQWLLDVQLAAAGAELPLIHDLAVGVDPAGADAWQWQDVLAGDMSVGAPPDEFNTQGQDWGVPPFDPWKLRDARYGPFIETVRSAFRHAGGIRLDHVMGLFRLYWVPRGTSAAAGTYVRYPAADLLDIVALESHRAGAYVVGEDLGTVEEEMREELARRHVLSYRVLWFERTPPEEWPVEALAAVTTHDLPTIAGLWGGTDLEEQRRLGLVPNEEATEATREHLASMTLDGQDVVDGAYAALGRTPCLLLTGTLDDALGVEERPNMPGTLDEWPNWSIALPVPLEQIEQEDGPRRVAEKLRRDG